MDTRAEKSRQTSIRHRLVFLVIACVLPVWVAAGYLVYHNYQSKRALTEQGMLDTARALTMVVDRELSNMQASLIALATSPSLATGDLHAFYRQAGLLLKAHPGADIILSDATGQQLINTFRPFGSPLPKRSEPDVVRQSYSAEKPIITNIFRGAMTGRFVISADIPVFRDGQVVYDLAMVTPADRFTKILSQQQLPPDWIARILDSNQIVVARTRLAEKFVGQAAVPVMRQRVRGASEGTQEAINFEGVALFNSFSRSATSGWTVAIGVPKAIMMAEIWHWLWWTIAGTALLSLTGIALALPIGRNVEKIEGGLRRLAAIVECSDDAIYSKSLDGIITTWNRGAEQLYGYTAAEAIGQSMMLIVPPERHEELRELLQRIRRGDRIEHYECVRVCKDGRRADISVTLSPMDDERGEITGASAIARDITEHKRVQILRESEQRLNRKLATILSPDGNLANLDLADILDIQAIQSLAEDFSKLTHIPIFVLDLKGKVLAGVGWQDICTKFHRVNSEACKNCLESDTLLTRDVAPGQLRQYKCKNNMWDIVTPITAGGEHVGNLYSGQFFFSDELVDYDLFRARAQQYGFDKEEYLTALERVPRLNREYVSIGMDFFIKLAEVLSEVSYSRIKLARSLAEIGRINTELAASNKELEAFTYSVSHDLRAPLRHIDGFSKMLLERYSEQLDAKGRHYFEEVRTGTRNMGRLVDELLALSRIGRQEPQLQATGLNSLFEEVRTELMKDADDRQIEWKIEALPFVECDPTLMRQVVTNLLSNAVKYTRPRAPAVIEVGQTQQGGESVVFVRDNGVGFNMKYADKLFGVFQRLHRAEDFEGTGVGLATVQRIIHKHNGRVWAEAELNKGATFYFTLGGSQTAEPANKYMTTAGGNDA
jgi:PAS domain S-box-containing protein